MSSLRYRVICDRVGERVTFDFEHKQAAVEAERAMKTVGYRANWHSYLPQPEALVMS